MPERSEPRRCAVTWAEEAGKTAASQLATALALPLLTPGTGSELPSWLLTCDASGLWLTMTASGSPGPVQVNFTAPGLRYRVQDAALKQDLARAVGCRSGLRPTVLDATAGLGKDAFLLASLGCQVTLMERDPVILALLTDGLRRAAVDADPTVRETVSRMHLVPGAFPDQMPAELRPDTVYLDPMFPARRKSARVKKDLFLLQCYFADHAAAPDVAADAEMLDAALALAGRRVVVKRPRLAAPLGGRHPALDYRGDSSRYDVYLSS